MSEDRTIRNRLTGWGRRGERPSAGGVVYDLRVAEAALREIERQLCLIPSSELGENWGFIVNMDAAIGAWRRGLVARPAATVRP